MADTNLKIKVSVEAQLQQLRAMEAQFQRQIVQLRTLGDTGSEALKTLERNLGLVRTQLGNISSGNKLMAAIGDAAKDIPALGVAMQALNGSAAPLALGVGAATYALTQFHASLNFADQLQDTSEQLNVTASSLQALNAHFGDGGVKAGAVAQVLQKLTASLADAAAGSAPMRAAFANLGLDVAELRMMGGDEALARVGRALAEHADDATAAAAAQDILGRGTGKLIALLKDLGVQGLDAVKGKMTETGRVLDDEMVKRLAAANQKLEELQQKWTIFKAETVGGVVDRAGKLAAGDGTEWRRTALEMTGPVGYAVSAGIDHMQKPSAEVTALRAANAKIAGDAKAEEERQALAAAAAAERARIEAGDRAKIAAEQAALDGKMLAQHTARLAGTDQIAVTEAEVARIRSLMPAEEEASIEAARKRVDLGTQLYAQAELLTNLRKQQAADDAKARAEDEAWLERIYAADAARIALRKKQRDQARDQDLARRLSAGDAGIAQLDQSKMLLDEKRDAEKLRIYAKQRVELAELIALREREQAINSTPEGQRGLDELRAKDTSISLAQADLQPQSAGEGGMAGMVAYLNSIPTAAERAQQAVMGIAQAMEEGIATSLTGLINQTMTWTQALVNIGQSIVQAIIQSFVRMAAQWITQQIIMAVFGKAIQAAQIAALLPIAAATTALWAPAATAASIATFGGAAVSGAAMAKTAIATAALGFAEGGLVSGPGTGTSDSIYARLSNGEYVMPAATVQAYGQGFFDDLRAGRTPTLASSPTAAGGGAGGAGGEPNVSMHQAFYFDREEAMRSALNSPAGRRMFVDMLRGSTSEL